MLAKQVNFSQDAYSIWSIQMRNESESGESKKRSDNNKQSMNAEQKNNTLYVGMIYEEWKIKQKVKAWGFLFSFQYFHTMFSCQ